MITIAPLRPIDQPAWAKLWAAYHCFYDIDLPPDVTNATWERIQSGRIQGFGAHDVDGQLIGIVHFLFHEDTWSRKSACYLQDLYVAQTSRGNGAGQRLIEAVATAAAAAGANSPYWLTHESNAAGRRLYDRIGKNLGFIQYTYGHAQP